MKRVKIVEVGPRDGLQNEPNSIPTEAKIEFIRTLAAAGLPEIEATSFVHPQRVPQLADAEAVLAALPLEGPPVFSALVPNEKGLERALASGVKRIAVFTAASESFVQRNIGMSRDESLARFYPIVQRALAAGLTVRGYVSTAFFCPFEGEVPPDEVTPIANALLCMGADEVSLGDTIGLAVPRDVQRGLKVWSRSLPLDQLAMHFHDTSGTALANVVAALDWGIETFDASAGGLGGCPFAPGATGNLATEDLVYLLDRSGIETGVDLAAVARASELIEGRIGRALTGRQYRRLQSQGAGTAGDAP